MHADKLRNVDFIPVCDTYCVCSRQIRRVYIAVVTFEWHCAQLDFVHICELLFNSSVVSIFVISFVHEKLDVI